MEKTKTEDGRTQNEEFDIKEKSKWRRSERRKSNREIIKRTKEERKKTTKKAEGEKDCIFWRRWRNDPKLRKGIGRFSISGSFPISYFTDYHHYHYRLRKKKNTLVRKKKDNNSSKRRRLRRPLCKGIFSRRCWDLVDIVTIARYRASGNSVTVTWYHSISWIDVRKKQRRLEPCRWRKFRPR